MPIHIVHPWVLLLLWAPLLLGAGALLAEAVSDRQLKRFAAEPMLSQLLPPANRRRRHLQLALAVPALMLLIIACSRPQWGRRMIELRERSRNLMVLLDVSRSMLAQDARPNRLERAKAELHDLVEALDGDRIGLIAFRNGAGLLCPLTRDYGFFKFALNGADLHSAPTGPTDIGASVRVALEALESASDGLHALLLMSDGEDLGDDALPAAREASQRGIPIFSVAIGSPEGALIPDGAGGWLEYEGEKVMSRPSLDQLQPMADLTGGVCVPLGDSGALQGATLGELYRHRLKTQAAVEQTVDLAQRHVDRQAWFLVPGILLLMVAAALSAGCQRLRTTAGLVLLCCLAGLGEASSTTPDGLDSLPPEPIDFVPAESPSEAMRQIQSAQAHFEAGEFTAAAAAYRVAAEALDPRRAEACRFNVALSLARGGNPAAAVQTLATLVPSAQLGGRAARLLGETRLALAAAVPPEAYPERIALLEASQEAFQAAIERLPDTAELSSALSAAASALSETRQEAHIAELLEQHGDTPPETLLRQMLQNQRQVAQQAASIRHADVPRRIADSEAAAALQDATRDLLIPLKPALLEQARASEDLNLSSRLEREIERLRDELDETARMLQDLLPEAATRAAESETSLFNLWQPLAAPPSLIEMALIAQSNALDRPPPPHDDPRLWQMESEALTTSFQERFPEWADAWNETAEMESRLEDDTREEIDRLTRDALSLQAEARRQLAASDPAATLQAEALAKLERIRELLPNPPPEPEPDPQPDPPEPKEDPDQTDPTDQTDPPEPQDPPDPPPPPEDPDFERQLEQALRREREHADEQRRQAREQQPPAGVRDW